LNAFAREHSNELLRYVLISFGILFVLSYIIIVLIRIRYPFELEWIEGALVDHVNWLLTGHKLYVPPSLDFVPYFYTPLYFYASAALTKIMGIGFFPLRLLSFVASLGCFAIIYLFVKRETGSTFAGFLAMSFFIATYRITGSWFDLARIDMVFLLFLLWAIYLIRFHETWLGYVLAGVFISLSFLTKQNALIIAIPVALYCIIARPRLSIFFVGTAALLIGGSSVILNRIHDGWFYYYVFKLAPHHYMLRHRMIFFWFEDLLAPLPIASTFAIYYVIRRLTGSPKKPGLYYLLVTGGILGGTWITRMHTGAFVNVLIPAYAMIAILFALGFFRMLGYVKEISGNGGGRIHRNGTSFIYLICVVQFAALAYNPTHQLPTKADWEAGQRFIQTISGIPGDIWVPAHGYCEPIMGLLLQDY
jgi:4-amino-4-deoxy-L-arabinose transferase-like glycosyltransferase